MNSKVFIFVGLGFLVAGFAFYAWTRGDEKLSASIGAETSSDLPAKVAPSNAARGAGQLRRVLGARNASQLLKNVAASSAPAGESLYANMQLSLLCGGQSAQGGSAKSEQLKDFCNSPVPDWTTSMDGIRSLESGDPVGAAYEYSALLMESSDPITQGKTGAQDARELASDLEQIMSSGEPGAAAVISAEALEQIGHVARAFAEIPKELGLRMSEQELVTAQTLGARLAYCQTAGGCGVGELVTLQACAVHANCGGSTTALDVWTQTHTPNQIKVAKAIKAKILSGKGSA